MIQNVQPPLLISTFPQVLGDRSLKFKYTNPGVIFLAMGRENGDGELPSVTATLVSADDGAVLYQQTHEAAAGPVQVGFDSWGWGLDVWAWDETLFNVCLFGTWLAGLYSRAAGLSQPRPTASNNIF